MLRSRGSEVIRFILRYPLTPCVACCGWSFGHSRAPSVAAAPPLVRLEAARCIRIA